MVLTLVAINMKQGVICQESVNNSLHSSLVAVLIDVYSLTLFTKHVFEGGNTNYQPLISF